MKFYVLKKEKTYIKDEMFESGVLTESLSYAKWFETEKQAKEYIKENNIDKKFEVMKHED